MIITAYLKAHPMKCLIHCFYETNTPVCSPPNSICQCRHFTTLTIYDFFCMFVSMKRTGIDSKCNNSEYCFAYKKEAMFYRTSKKPRVLDSSALECDGKYTGCDSPNHFGPKRFFQSSPQWSLEER